jgi:hypothetical protein
MRVVHVRVPRAAFADILGKMREWLDRNGRPLVRFETETDGDSILINVQFDGDIWQRDFGKPFAPHMATKLEPRAMTGYASPAGPMSR